jgi:hypothetical protein
VSALSQLAREPGGRSNGRPGRYRRGRGRAMRALRGCWNPRSTAGLPSGFTSTLGHEVESLGGTIPSQGLTHRRRYALSCAGPVSCPWWNTAPKSRLPTPSADHAKVTPAPAEVLAIRAVGLSCLERRAHRRSMAVRDRVILRARGRRSSAGNDAVRNSRWGRPLW